MVILLRESGRIAVRDRRPRPTGASSRELQRRNSDRRQRAFEYDPTYGPGKWGSSEIDAVDCLRRRRETFNSDRRGRRVRWSSGSGRPFLSVGVAAPEDFAECANTGNRRTGDKVLAPEKESGSIRRVYRSNDEIIVRKLTDLIGMRGLAGSVVDDHAVLREIEGKRRAV